MRRACMAAVHDDDIMRDAQLWTCSLTKQCKISQGLEDMHGAQRFVKLAIRDRTGQAACTPCPGFHWSRPDHVCLQHSI